MRRTSSAQSTQRGRVIAMTLDSLKAPREPELGKAAEEEDSDNEDVQDRNGSRDEIQNEALLEIDKAARSRGGGAG